MVSCLGSLVQSRCGEGGALQTDLTGLCGEHSQCSGHTGFAPLMGVCSPRLYCSGSRLLSRERALRGVDFPGLSRSDSGFRVFHKGAGSVGPTFCAFPGGVAQAARSLRSALSPGAARLLPSVVPASVSLCSGHVRLVSVLGSWTLAATLLADVDHPESQGSLWLEAGGLFAVW